MARRLSQVDPCMICQSLPCQCDQAAKPKKAASPKRVTKSEQTTVADAVPPEPPRQSMADRMRARAAAVLPAPPQSPARAKPTAKSAELPELRPDDAMEVAAIRALSVQFQVEGEAVDRWRGYLEKDPSRAERVAAWKMKR